MSEKGQSRHIFRRQTDGEGSEITLARILDKNFDSTNVFDQFLVQMSRCVGMGEAQSLCSWEAPRPLQPVPYTCI